MKTTYIFLSAAILAVALSSGCIIDDGPHHHPGNGAPAGAYPRRAPQPAPQQVGYPAPPKGHQNPPPPTKAAPYQVHPNAPQHHPKPEPRPF